ncbi:MAG: sulfatase-like hydrolase/transferase [Oligoflexia bacterium]|nr:sulfatase-like hydrolase/transferase [Oligoflexia bacterium]
MERFFNRFFQLIALCAFAIGQPLLDKLGAHPEFFVAHRNEHVDFFYLAAALIFIPPALLAIIEAPFFFLNAAAGTAVHVIICSALAGLTALPVFTAIPGLTGTLAITSAFLFMIGFGLLFSRYLGLQRFCVALALAALAFPIFFLTRPGIRELAYPKLVGSDVRFKGDKVEIPLVMIVFDELPLTALLDGSLTIDAQRFPNFARLASTSDWFKNATAVSTHTTLAVPAILTGRLPTKEQRLPVLQSHPENLFTLLQASRHLHAIEQITRLCPDNACQAAGAPANFAARIEGSLADIAAIYLNIVIPQDLGLALPNVSTNWTGFWSPPKSSRKKKSLDSRRKDRVRTFRSWIQQIDGESTAVLHYAHQLLPHMPYQFVPSGRAYQAGDVPRSYRNEAWENDDVGITQAYQMFLLQVAACDTLLGELIDKLKAEELWDKSLVVVTADHGASFEANAHRRSHPHNARFFEDMLPIPLFIKRPGQTTAAVSEVNAESIDILPSIVDVLGINTAWQFDGSSLFKQGAVQRSKKRIIVGEKRKQSILQEENLSYEILEFDVPATLPRTTLDWKTARFNNQPGSPGGLFALPLHRELLGTRPEASSAALSLDIRNPSVSPGQAGGVVLNFRPESKTTLAFVSGAILGDLANRNIRSVAISINEKIEAITPTFLLPKGTMFFEGFFPEEVLKRGENQFAVYAIDDQNGAVVLIPARIGP